MVRKSLPILGLMLATFVQDPGSSAVRAANEGHGGGPGHAIGGFRGGWCGYGPGFRGCYGYPGWCGAGFGFGLGYGCWYGYPYYPYGPYSYGYGYPVYVDPSYGMQPNGLSPASVAARNQAPAPTSGPAVAGLVRLTDTDVLLSIRVTPDAIVRINGVPTTQNGPRRDFVSSGLAPGRTYTFVVTARWTAPNGQALEFERRVQVQGGERRNVDFFMPSPVPQNELLPFDAARR